MTTYRQLRLTLSTPPHTPTTPAEIAAARTIARACTSAAEAMKPCCSRKSRNARVLTFWQLSGSRKLARAVLWSSNKKTPRVGGLISAKPFMTSRIANSPRFALLDGDSPVADCSATCLAWCSKVRVVNAGSRCWRIHPAKRALVGVAWRVTPCHTMSTTCAAQPGAKSRSSESA